MEMEEKDKEWKQWENLPHEKEEELIEKVAQFFSKRRMGLFGQMMLETITPVARIVSEITMNLYGPFLDFLGVDGYTALFRRRENVQRLIERIDELEEEAMK